MSNSNQPTTTAQAGNPNDPWALSSTGYALDQFFVRATDGNGHDAVMSVKVSPALFGELQRIVQSKTIPAYRTYADIIRDALVHRLRWLADEYPGSTNLAALEIEQRQAEIDRLSTERATWRKLLTDLDTQLNDLIGQNELDEAEWLIAQNEWIDSMTPPYLLRLAKTLNVARRRIADARDDARRNA